MIWLLPGMDGTGALFGPLKRALDWDATEVRYVGESYDAIEAALPAALRTPAPDDVLVAESFGGPLALSIAARHPVARVVLVASFVRAPRPLPPLRLLNAGVLARERPRFAAKGVTIAPPRWAIRMAMLGLDAPSALVDEVASAIASVAPQTIARRIDALRALDARETLRAVKAPIVWLRAARDWLVPASATEHALAARPDLEVHVIDGPHLLAQRCPAEVARVIGSTRGSPTADGTSLVRTRE